MSEREPTRTPPSRSEPPATPPPRTGHARVERERENTLERIPTPEYLPENIESSGNAPSRGTVDRGGTGSSETRTQQSGNATQRGSSSHDGNGNAVEGDDRGRDSKKSGRKADAISMRMKKRWRFIFHFEPPFAVIWQDRAYRQPWCWPRIGNWLALCGIAWELSLSFAAFRKYVYETWTDGLFGK